MKLNNKIKNLLHKLKIYKIKRTIDQYMIKKHINKFVRLPKNKKN